MSQVGEEANQDRLPTVGGVPPHISNTELHHSELHLLKSLINTFSENGSFISIFQNYLKG